MLSDGDVTGSLRPPESPLSRALDEEDWRRAESALSVALDPQGNGAVVTWDNPQSGMKGSFIPVGNAFPADEKVCRAFAADLGGNAPAEHLQGVGCRDKSGEWTIRDVKSIKRA
jgi:surface antigen